MPSAMFSYNKIASGEVSLSDTAAQLPDVACHYATLKANPGNSGIVYVGGEGVTAADMETDQTSGFPLSAGEQLDVVVANLNMLYAIATTDGDSLSYFLHI